VGSFPNYGAAFIYAQALANKMRMDVGLARPFQAIDPAWTVFLLPKPENRQGFELRCQVVQPEVWQGR
jgi:hypothetical protein